jgi:hypothetical protein
MLSTNYVRNSSHISTRDRGLKTEVMGDVMVEQGDLARATSLHSCRKEMIKNARWETLASGHWDALALAQETAHHSAPSRRIKNHTDRTSRLTKRDPQNGRPRDHAGSCIADRLAIPPRTQPLTTDSANLLASDISQKLGHLIAGLSETTRTRQALPPGEVDIFKPEQHRRGFPRRSSELVASLDKPARGWWGYHPAFSLHIKI